MERLVTAEESQRLDRYAEEAGFPSLALMENASLRLAEVVTQHFELDPPKYIVVVAGKGNNGGDGMALARHLFNAGYRVEVFLLADPDELRGDAATNYKAAVNFGVCLRSLSNPDELPRLINPLRSSDLVIDAILGTGITGRVRGIYAEAIPLINENARQILSVDVPSGINSDTGEVCGVAIRATTTVTLGAVKLGLVAPEAAEYVGDLFVGSLGVPKRLMERLESRRFLTTSEIVPKVLRPRRLNSHKGDYGRVLIIGGAPGMTGAAIMAGKAALRGGAGLAQVALPQSLNLALEAATLEVMSFPVPETEEGTIAPQALKVLAPRIEWADVIAIGCGISRHEKTQTFVRELITRVDKPVVIDADGLIALAGHTDILRRRHHLTVLTPHPGEMAVLLGTKTQGVQRDRFGTATEAAKRFKAIVVLKGARTVTASPDGTLFVNPTGNPGMASGGMGDVLTGMIAALLAQRLAQKPDLPPSEAAETVACAVFLHGLAGDIAVWEKSETALVAGDLLDHLPRAINEPELAQPLTLRPLSPFVRFLLRGRSHEGTLSR